MWPFKKKQSVGPTEPVSFSAAMEQSKAQELSTLNPIPHASTRLVQPNSEEAERIFQKMLARITQQIKEHDFYRDAELRPAFNNIEAKSGAAEKVRRLIINAGYKVEQYSEHFRIGL